MTSLSLSLLLQLTVLSGGVEAQTVSYATARRQAESGKPIVVLVGTDWCGPCQRMKNTVLPEVQKRGLLSKVAFTIVNPDREGKLARQLTGGSQTVPQLIMYRRTSNGWLRRKLVGGQSVTSVEGFIQKGISANNAEKKERKTAVGKNQRQSAKKAEKQPSD